MIVQMEPFLAGAGICLSLIVALGAQNTFVLRCGLNKQHLWTVVLFCSASDVLLFCLAILGAGLIAGGLSATVLVYIRSAGALWLSGYGLMRLVSAWRGTNGLSPGSAKPSRASTLLQCAAFSWLNPHVYLDMLLISGISLVYSETERWLFAMGAGAASIAFFHLLGFFASASSRWLGKPGCWRVIDAVLGAMLIGMAAQLFFTR